MGWRARDVGEGKGRGGWEQDGMRGGVGKGARGVVQFRVGITLDFRGDVATSPALLLLYPPRVTTLLLRRYLRRPPTSPSTPSPPASAPPCLLFCHFSARRPPTPRTTGKEHPDYLREIDLSARYPIYRPRRKHIALDDISPSFSSSGLNVTVRRRPALSKKDGQLCHAKYIPFFSSTEASPRSRCRNNQTLSTSREFVCLKLKRERRRRRLRFRNRRETSISSLTLIIRNMALCKHHETSEWQMMPIDGD